MGKAIHPQRAGTGSPSFRAHRVGTACVADHGYALAANRCAPHHRCFRESRHRDFLGGQGARDLRVCR